MRVGEGEGQRAEPSHCITVRLTRCPTLLNQLHGTSAALPKTTFMPHPRCVCWQRTMLTDDSGERCSPSGGRMAAIRCKWRCELVSEPHQGESSALVTAPSVPLRTLSRLLLTHAIICAMVLVSVGLSPLVYRVGEVRRVGSALVLWISSSV